MTDEILGQLKRWNDGEDADEVSQGYQTVATMKHFGLSPGQWVRLPRRDKKVLFYHRLMEHFYERKSMKESERKAEQEAARAKFVASLPAQAPRSTR